MPGFPVKTTGTHKSRKAPFVPRGRPALHLNLKSKQDAGLQFEAGATGANASGIRQ